MFYYFITQQPKADPEFIVEALLVIADNIQTTALQWAIGTEGSHEHMPPRLD
jgi:hypothetical protein